MLILATGIGLTLLIQSAFKAQNQKNCLCKFAHCGLPILKLKFEDAFCVTLSKVSRNTKTVTVRRSLLQLPLLQLLRA